jgi:hypothetical protein
MANSMTLISPDTVCVPDTVSAPNTVSEPKTDSNMKKSSVEHAANPERDGPWSAVFIVAISILAIHFALALIGGTAILAGELQGPDSYMRLNRILQLWHAGDWFDPVYHRINPPEGHVQHWTRPMDLLLIVGALFGAPFVGFANALHGWAVAVGPALHVVALFATIWTASAIIDRNRLWIVAFLFILQPGLFNAFMVGRPDHQGLILITAIVFVGLVLRLLSAPRHQGLALASGIAAAFALWISIETLPLIVLAIAVLAIRWLVTDPRTAYCLFLQSSAIVVAIFVALIIERGASNFGRVQYDTLSVTHLGLFALNTGVWAALYLLTGTSQTGLRGKPSGRLALAALLGATGAAVLWLFFPGFVGSPLDNVDPLYREMRLEKIHEIQPLVGQAAIALNGLATELARGVMWLGQAALALPWAIWIAMRTWRVDRDPGLTYPWLLLGAGLALFVAMTLAQTRWAPYEGLFAILVYAHLASVLLARIEIRISTARLSLARPLAVVALSLWPFAPLIILSSRFEAATAHVAVGHCGLTAAAEFMSTGSMVAPARVMAFVDSGPELLYRTPHSVYSIPNHRPQPGFTTTYRAMTATDVAEAQILINKSGANYLLVCGAGSPLTFYGSRPNPDPSSGPMTLHEALVAGQPPTFLQPVALPEAAGTKLLLYAVEN